MRAEKLVVLAFLLAVVSDYVVFSQPISIKVLGTESVSVMPGQSFELGITIQYKDQQPIPVVVTANITESTDAQLVRLSGQNTRGSWLINGSNVISIAIQGSPNQSVSMCLQTMENNSVHFNFSFELTPCLIGFEFNNETSQCACNSELSTIGIYCDIIDGKITIPSHIWFGPVEVVEVDLPKYGYTQLYKEYGKTETVNLYSTSDNLDFDFQCRDQLNRSGVGCGACELNHSALLGSIECWECTNVSLLLCLLFLVTGLLTVIGITVFRTTIAEGYLYAVLFYSNIANLFAIHFTPAVNGKGAFFLTAWISQNLGIPACFYNGMTTLAVTGMHLLYIIYLAALTSGFTLIMRCKQFPYSKEYSPSKTLGTLLIICYTSLLETCLVILSFSIVTTLEGETLLRWHYDPNVVYFSGAHAFLCVVAIFIFILYIIPFPLLVISPRITYKIRVFSKLQPLLEVFWAPFKPKYCWWVAFRLFVRFLSVLFANFVPLPYNILSVCTLLILHMFVQSQIKPFHGFWQNVLDETLVLNLVILLSGYFYFLDYGVVSVSLNELIFEYQVQAFASVLVVVAYLLFIVVFIHHLFLRFPSCKPMLRSLPSKVNNVLSGRHTYTMEELTLQEVDQTPPLITHSEINITREEKEQDKQTLTRELQALEETSTDVTTDTRARVKSQSSRATKKRHSRKTKSSPELQEFPLVVENVFTKDREPLLVSDEHTM